jgi:elongation factor G
MKVYQADQIRNVGVIGHGDSGKTSLVSALLHSAGAINRLGKVDDGTTVTDFDPEEIDRKITIASAICYAEWKKNKINFIDTPGYGNFILDAKSCLRVVESALVTVCAVSGVEVQTEKGWAFCEEFGLSRIVVLNKLDRDRADFDRAMESISKTLGRNAVPVQLPIGKESSFSGVIDLLSMKAHTYEQEDESGKFTTGDIPDELQERAAAEREKLVEMVAEMDDALLEKFFEEGELSQDELIQGLKAGIRDLKIFPVFCASAGKNIGMHSLLNALIDFGVSPADRTTVPGIDKESSEKVDIPTGPDAPLTAFVFKTNADPYAGKITLFRVFGGSVSSDSTLFNVTQDSQERLGAISLLQGKTPEQVAEVAAGDIGSVAKLKVTQTGDTFRPKGDKVVVAPVKLPQPAMSYAIEPKSRGDEDKISSAMTRILEEDPTLRWARDGQTHELLISGMGQTHVEVAVSKLKRRFGVEVILHPPKVPYLETIKGKAEVQGRHKKQTGGRGQFADCWIRFEPLPQGEDFEFGNEIFGGSIPRNYVPAVEKGIQEARLRGFLAGFPMIDFKATVYDGSYHNVDSSEMAFKIAASLAFRKAMAIARPTLLEPVMDVEVIAPEECMGDIMGDMNSRRGKVQGMTPIGTNQLIRVQVPMAEMLSYMPTLNSITGGRGSYTMAMSHYEEVPAHLMQKVIDEHKKGGEEEEES